MLGGTGGGTPRPSGGLRASAGGGAPFGGGAAPAAGVVTWKSTLPGWLELSTLVPGEAVTETRGVTRTTCGTPPDADGDDALAESGPSVGGRLTAPTQHPHTDTAHTHTAHTHRHSTHTPTQHTHTAHTHTAHTHRHGTHTQTDTAAARRYPTPADTHTPTQHSTLIPTHDTDPNTRHRFKARSESQSQHTAHCTVPTINPTLISK